MSEKRCFSAMVLSSDAYLDLSPAAQCLYVQLNLQSDDRGFVGNASAILRMIGAEKNTLQELVESKFLIKFASSDYEQLQNDVYLIRHFNVHNSLRNDRKPNNYPFLLDKVTENESGEYEQGISKVEKSEISTSEINAKTKAQEALEQEEAVEDVAQVGACDVEKAVESVEKEQVEQTEQTVENYFFDCWNNTKDSNGLCIFPIGASVKNKHDWRTFWKNNKPTKEQLQTAFRNIADGVNSGSLERQYLPSTPDSFVSKNWIYRSQTPYKKQQGNAQSEEQMTGIDWTAVNF